MTSQPWNQTDFRVVIGSTGIGYDPNKEEINRKKHGYSLQLTPSRRTAKFGITT